MSPLGLSAMQIEWLKFGKVAPTPRGPVLSGIDHAVTARSRQFPASLLPYCNPGSTGVGFPGSLARWQEYPWNGIGGGLVWRAVMDGASAYVLVGRLRGRSEEGEGVPGRLCTEAAYAAVPADQWSPSLGRSLFHSLVAEPSTQAGDSLSPMFLDRDGDSAPLQPGWIESVRHHIISLLSGCPSVVPPGDIDTFLDLVVGVSCVLPRALTWRLPVGAGVWEPAPWMAMACAVELPCKVIALVPAAQHYADWACRALADARTVEDVVQEVGRAFPEFSRCEADSVDATWQDVAHAVCDEVSRRRAERRIVLQARCVRGIFEGRSRRRSVDRALTKASRRDWAPAWSAAAQEPGPVGDRARAVGHLVGVLPGPSVADVELAWDTHLPGSAEDVLRRLEDSYVGASASDMPRWIRACSFRHDPSAAAWYRVFCQSCEPFALRKLLDSDLPAEFIAGALPGRGVGGTIRRLILREPTSDYEIQDLAVQVQEWGVASANRLMRVVADHLKTDVPTISLGVLLDECETRGLYPALAGRLRLPSVTAELWEDEAVQQLAAELASRPPKRAIPRCVIPLLLSRWGALAGEVRSTVARAIGDQLPSPYAEILVGASSGESPSISPDEAHRMALHLVRQSDSVAERLVRMHCPDAPPTEHCEMLAAWISAREIAELPTDPILAALATIHGSGSLQPLLEPRLDRAWVAVVAARSGFPPNSIGVFSRAKSIRELGALALMCRGMQKPEVDAELMARYLDHVAIAGSSIVDPQPGWRLACWEALGDRPASITDWERRILDRVEPSTVIRLAMKGVPVPRSELERIGAVGWRSVAGSWGPAIRPLLERIIALKLRSALRILAAERLRGLAPDPEVHRETARWRFLRRRDSAGARRLADVRRSDALLDAVLRGLSEADIRWVESHADAR